MTRLNRILAFLHTEWHDYWRERRRRLLHARLARQPWGFDNPSVGHRVGAFAHYAPIGTRVNVWVLTDNGYYACQRIVTGVPWVQALQGAPSIGMVRVGDGEAQIEMTEVRR